LFGEGHSPQTKTIHLAGRYLHQISDQLSRLLFGREEPTKLAVVGFDVDDWEHISSSKFLWTCFAGTEGSGNARVLVFEAEEKLDQGSIHFSGEELGEAEMAAWGVKWMNQVKTWEKPDSFLTPQWREILDKNLALHRQLEGKLPDSLDEK
jgi:hypothetical protein